MAGKRKITDAQVKAAIKKHKKGKLWKQIAKEYGIAQSALMKRVKKMPEYAPPVKKDKSRPMFVWVGSNE